MKRGVFAAAIVVALTGSALAGHAATDFVKTGSILVGAPTTELIDSTFLVGDCGATNRNVPNVDADWVQLPETAPGLEFTLTGTDATDGQLNDVQTSPDLDIYFLDAGCNLLDYDNNDGDEAGIVPAGAAYADVAAWFGVEVSYTLTVTGAIA